MSIWLRSISISSWKGALLRPLFLSRDLSGCFSLGSLGAFGSIGGLGSLGASGSLLVLGALGALALRSLGSLSGLGSFGGLLALYIGLDRIWGIFNGIANACERFLSGCNKD